MVCEFVFAADSKYANPDISANFLTLLQEGNRGKNAALGNRNGLSLQEAELQFVSDVDVYFKANALFSINRPTPAQDYKIDPEEVYVETISLPVVTLKAGKFKAALGRHNQLHTHAFPFIDAPIVNRKVLGDEGLNEVGLSASTLIPAPWFMEITAQVLGGENSNILNK